MSAAKAIEPERNITEREARAAIGAFKIGCWPYRDRWVAAFKGLDVLVIASGVTRLEAIEAALRSIGGAE
jgi:hypothetical protein